MLTGYLERSSSHGPMLAYLMLHLQVGIRTQTRTEIATLSVCGVVPLDKSESPAIKQQPVAFGFVQQLSVINNT